jgi:hypothetical protein
MTPTTDGTTPTTTAPADRDAYLRSKGWTVANRVWNNLPLYHDPAADPYAAPMPAFEAVRIQWDRDRGEAPAEERLLMSSLPASAVHVLQLTYPSPDATGCCRGFQVLLEAQEAQALVERLGLGADVYTPLTGTPAAKPCLVLGDAVVNGHDSDNRPTYGPPWSFPVAGIATNTRRFSQPRRQQTERELDAIRLQHARDEASRLDYERHRNRELEEKQRQEAVKRASPFFRLKALEEKLAALLGEDPPRG